MDITSNLGHLSGGTIVLRGGGFFLWIAAFMVSMDVIGWIPTVPVFIIAFMRIEGREPWRITIILATVMTALTYGVFDQLLSIPWLPSWLGSTYPALKIIPSV